MIYDDSNYEIEYKYKADHILLEDFFKACVNQNDLYAYNNIYQVWGTDIYYKHNTDPSLIRRLRIDNNKVELTHKKLLNKDDSAIRIEIDIPLKINSKQETNTLISRVTTQSELLGFTYSFTIEKNNYIIQKKDVNYAYYIVDHKDIYIEVEVNKNLNKPNTEAIQLLDQEERFGPLSKLGLTKKDRVFKSLRDIYQNKK